MRCANYPGRALIALVSVAAIACGSPESETTTPGGSTATDSGTQDAGPADSSGGTDDTGTAGGADTGGAQLDSSTAHDTAAAQDTAGPKDTATPKDTAAPKDTAGSPDAGSPIDSGSATDAGVPVEDAGSSTAPDSGVGPSNDAGTTVDSGPAAPTFACIGKPSCSKYGKNAIACKADPGCTQTQFTCTISPKANWPKACKNYKFLTHCNAKKKYGCVFVKGSNKCVFDANFCTKHKTSTGCAATIGQCAWTSWSCAGTATKLGKCGDHAHSDGCKKVPGCLWSDCKQTNGGKEICDGLDNDCDGVTDTGPGAPGLCSDGDVCNGAEVCKAGKCGAGKKLTCPAKACRAASCDKTKGCMYAVVKTGACDDGSKCTTGDHCVNGVCAASKAVKCDDSNKCTTDTCIAATGCKHVAAPAFTCDDGDKCTGNGKCSKGKCANAKPITCPPKPCNTAKCDKVKGCMYAPASGGACTDGNVCTDKDVCKTGKCTGQPRNCDDGNSCTTNTCVSAGNKGCHKVHKSGACDDGSKCTTGDACVVMVCKGKASACSDGKPCTADSCDPKTGKCTFVPMKGCGWKGALWFLKHTKLGQRTVVDIDLGKDGSVFVAGGDMVSSSKVFGRLLKAKVDGSGWQFSHAHYLQKSNLPRSMRVFDGHVHMGAQSRPNYYKGNSASYMHKFDEKGAVKFKSLIWIWGHQGTNWMAPFGVAKAPGGSFEAGYAQAHTKNYVGYVIRRDDKGAKKWVKTFTVTASWKFNVTGLTADAKGNNYVVGTAPHDVDGGGTGKYLGGTDAFMQRRDVNGTLAWSRQFGTSTTDHGRKVELAPDGTLWVVGATHATLPGQKTAGARDIFVMHFDANGKQLPQTRQFGTKWNDFGYNLDVDSAGSVYVVGNYATAGVQLAKVDKTGKLAWHKQWVAVGGAAAGIAVKVAGNGDVVFAGHASKAFGGLKHPGGFQLYIARTDKDGNLFK